MLYLRADLLEKSVESSKQSTGEQRGGSYVARVKTGVEKDGSPKYRYFTSEEEYKSYLEKHGSDKKQVARGHSDSSKIKEKVAEEHKASTEKVHASQKQALLHKSQRLIVRI